MYKNRVKSFFHAENFNDVLLVYKKKWKYRNNANPVYSSLTSPFS